LAKTRNEGRLSLLLLLALPAWPSPSTSPGTTRNFAYGPRPVHGQRLRRRGGRPTAFRNPAGWRPARLSYFQHETTTDPQYDLRTRSDRGHLAVPCNFKSRLNQIDFFSVSAPSRIGKRDWTFALSYYRYIPYGFKGSAQSVLTYLDDRFNPRKTTVTFRAVKA
jgi:hypothetical protein